MSDEEKIGIKLKPYHVLQIARWRSFIFDTINLQSVATNADKAGVVEAINEICLQSLASMTDDQITDANLEKALRDNLS